jgi:rRNA maturation RNase YbeY
MVSSESVADYQSPKGIFFHSEDIDFQLDNESQTSLWLKKIIEQEGCTLLLLNFIFCSDDYLHQLNMEYLNHNTLTDIITFPYQSPPQIEGDIFISIDRVTENSEEFNTLFDNELKRVMAHGVLHLCGYNDKTEQEKKQMQLKEEEKLELLKNFLLA